MEAKQEILEAEARTFVAGDLAVYPAHGVGRIESIESKTVNGEEHDFYIMKVLESSMVIMIPTRNVASVGLRDIIGKKEIPKVYDIMKANHEGTGENQTWNRRYREYTEALRYRPAVTG